MAEEKQCKGLSHGAYEGVSGEDYQPYVSAEKTLPELTPLSIGLGIILSVVFGVTMVYLGLKIGMTVSASIPAAVMSMGILKGIFKRGSILENNVVQTITVSGEAIAAGLIFTIPAAFLWPEYADYANPLTHARLFLIALIGGLLGVLMMIPLRNFLIVKEHGKLKYPEGTACAEVLVAGDVGGNPAKLVVSGIVVGGLYQLLQQWGKLFKRTVSTEVPIMKNTVLSGELTPILLGVGYIIGLEVAFIMLAGGLLAWFVLIPLITYLGSNMPAPVAPETVKLISQMGAEEIWSSYIRYIGAGAVAMGGVISLAKSMPVIISSFKASFKELLRTFSRKNGQVVEKGPATRRTFQDIPIQWCLVISGVLLALIVLTRNISHNFFLGGVGAVLVFIFGFFFVTVSSRIVGLIGTSSNPVSGMTIGTLIVSTIIFHSLGFRGIEGMMTSLIVGAFVCLAMCMAGDISQDLKTGFLVGSTPWRLQVGQIIGTFSAALFVVATVLWLVPYIGLPAGHPDKLIAPQANLMAILIKGIMDANLPWALVFTGAFIAVVVELVGVPALPFAVGLYLPLELSTPLVIGGLLAHFTRKKYVDPEEYKDRNEKGVLVSSGLIAGDALMGLFALVLTANQLELPKILIRYFHYDPTGLWNSLNSTGIPAIFAFSLVVIFLWYSITRGAAKTASVVAPVCENVKTEVVLTEETVDEFGNPIINIPYHTDLSLKETSGIKQEEKEEKKNTKEDTNG